ncbi:MAG TPA: phytanoyl-CoA dioxygenase family protein [Planctomycetota bacterium]|nr:phytanoyl-CoA dioxygenase family protein [Planctomycetota bacterium]
MPATATATAAPLVEASAAERFAFDLQGFIVLRGVLTRPECDSLAAAVRRLEDAPRDDDAWRARLRPENRAAAAPTRWEQAAFGVRMNGLLRLDPIFHALIDHPRVLPLLRSFMDRPQLINTWSIAKRGGTGDNGWHRGASPLSYWCRDGQIRTTMLNVVWFLSRNGPEDGCMMIAPGSHKSGLALLSEGSERIPVLPGGHDFDYHDPRYARLALPGSTIVNAEPGDVLLMSESVLHGGLPRTTPGVRTNLYFNHLEAVRATALVEPGNMRHFWLPETMRAAMTPTQREVTAWMEYARYELDE